MERTKICLCLTGKTLKEDLEMIERYRNYIDIAELRVDFLEYDERLSLRHFPEKAGLPVCLTIRRTVDGGNFVEGEAARTTLYARALAFAEQDARKNYAYIDLEDDFYVPSLQDAALAFGTRIIRSYHNMTGAERNFRERMEHMRTTGFEIPKIAFMPETLNDITNLFRESRDLQGDRILLAMGGMGMCTRLLANQLGSYLTYTTASESEQNLSALGQIDPKTLCDVYNFRQQDDNTRIFGVTGWPLKVTDSPRLHNRGYQAHGMNSVYIPVPSDSIENTLRLADEIGMQGISVTVPYKETVMPNLAQVSVEVGDIGACNTIVKHGNDWNGYNTDAYGLRKALNEFLNRDSLFGKKVAIIGAGGAAKAAAYVVKQMHGRACIFNRTVSKAKKLADQYGFKYAPLSAEGLDMLEYYSNVIIQTTSIGNGCFDQVPDQTNDPLYFYNFHGHEKVYDVIYKPARTPMLQRAEKAGCAVENGFGMLAYQGHQQFKLYTGVDYE